MTSSRHNLRRWFSGLLLLSAAVAVAQAQQGFRGSWRGEPLHEGVPDVRGGFSFCRLTYTRVRVEGGGQGWRTDYPNADNNFMTRLTQLTAAPVNRWDNGDLGFTVVSATDPALFQCPFLFASDIGSGAFSDVEAQRLREYLLKGGFLWVDDFWGDAAWRQWLGEIKLILPEYSVVDLTLDHPMFSVFYQVKEIPQIPSIQFWRRNGGGTSERGYESATPEMRAIFDDHGRMIVLMSHDTDIADGWERETEDEDFFYAFTARAYGVGINVALWSMSH
ncbi:MAG TPA: DUF4159 domain-containing protein [Longimicrobiales bacterium]|nr:DUF4159 domain-containing protein [Longimicrobiales bacterium]